MREYGIELLLVNKKRKEYFGYIIDNGKKRYVCHAYDADTCSEMLEKITHRVPVN